MHTGINEPDLVNQPDEGDPLILLRKCRDELSRNYPSIEILSEYYKSVPSREEISTELEREIAEETKQEENLPHDGSPPLFDEGNLHQSLLPKTRLDWVRRRMFAFLCVIPFLLVLLMLPGCFSRGWLQSVSKPCVLALMVVWPVVFLAALKIDRFFFLKYDLEKLSQREPVSKLLGTLTFQHNKLYFFDSEAYEGEITVLPGEYCLYGCVDFDWPSYAFLSNQTVTPDFDTALDVISERNVEMAKESIEIVVDSGLITFSDSTEQTKATWEVKRDNRTVREIRLRDDGSVAGLKLYPSYGDGDYRVYVHKNKIECNIVTELIGPDE